MDIAAEIAGERLLSPPGATVGLLEQEVERGEESTCAFIARRTGVTCSAPDGRPRRGVGHRGRLQCRAPGMARSRGADFDGRYERVAVHLGLDVASNLPMTALSGR
ncbi:hypothetical protein M0E87_04695 [Corynebacterium sp. CCM 9185]|uniref:hypothetical protein n=1 Tax=Corynebacterium marambiense TaxID=2765364 RepID=UPI001E52A159|nr:hypothetical protein [Corynebacterium marambiense]MCK7662963.1 hypothetical protein [Corynebacterium marambiense]MCX7542572.1 hypothetical protein [Corynebacterium marambiense]